MINISETKEKENNLNEITNDNEFTFNFFNINYTLKIENSQQKNIIFKYVNNTSKTIIYQKIFNLKQLHELNEIFTKFNEINDIYLYLINLIKNNQDSIIISSLEDCISIEIILAELDSKNNLKIILEKITENDFSSDDKNNCINYFNQKYNTNITLGERELNLSRGNHQYFDGKIIRYGINEKEDLKNEGLNILCQIKFNQLQELYLYNNKITDISVFENVKFNQLKRLDLSKNKISDISILEKVEFDELKALYLNDNNISDINILDKVKFLELMELYLHKNQISDISVLKNVKFNKLQGLYLSFNCISDIYVLERIKMNQLQVLHLIGLRINYSNIKNQDIINNLKKKIRFVFVNKFPSIFK